MLYLGVVYESLMSASPAWFSIDFYDLLQPWTDSQPLVRLKFTDDVLIVNIMSTIWSYSIRALTRKWRL